MLQPTTRFIAQAALATSMLVCGTSAHAVCTTLAECARIVNGMFDGLKTGAAPNGNQPAVAEAQPHEGVLRVAVKPPQRPPQRVSNPEEIRKLFTELRRLSDEQAAVFNKLVQLRMQDPDFQQDRLSQIAAENGLDLSNGAITLYDREINGIRPPAFGKGGATYKAK